MMTNYKTAIDIAPYALNSMHLIGNFKELFDPSLEIVKNNKDMKVLVEKTWEQSQKRYSAQHDPTLGQYPALLSSVILIANHYDDVKNMDIKHLSALSHATYYLTNGITTDLVLLFGDGILMDKIMQKTETKNIDNFSKAYYTLNTMGNFLNQYNNLKPTTSSDEIKQYLNNYIDSLDIEQVKHLDPMYKLSTDDINIAYELLFSTFTTKSEGEPKHENRRL